MEGPDRPSVIREERQEDKSICFAGRHRRPRKMENGCVLLVRGKICWRICLLAKPLIPHVDLEREEKGKEQSACIHIDIMAREKPER